MLGPLLVVVHAYNPSTGEVGVGGRGQPERATRVGPCENTMKQKSNKRLGSYSTLMLLEVRK